MCRAFFTPFEAAKIVKDLTGLTTATEDSGVFEDPAELPNEGNEICFLECTKYMRNQLLRDSDVMSMAHGLELRVPLVDQRFYDSINTISPELRLRGNKQMMLDAVPEVPDWVWNKKKQGFRFPFEKWINEHWKNSFEITNSVISIPLGKWYRKWTVLTLLNFFRNSGIA